MSEKEGELKKRINEMVLLEAPEGNAIISNVTFVAKENFEKLIDEAKKDFPQKEHCSKTFGTGDNYDDYNVFDYPNYNTEDLESCQELIEEYEKAVKKWFGDSS